MHVFLLPQINPANNKKVSTKQLRKIVVVDHTYSYAEPSTPAPPGTISTKAAQPKVEI